METNVTPFRDLNSRDYPFFPLRLDAGERIDSALGGGKTMYSK